MFSRPMLEYIYIYIFQEAMLRDLLCVLHESSGLKGFFFGRIQELSAGALNQENRKGGNAVILGGKKPQAFTLEDP